MGVQDRVNPYVIPYTEGPSNGFQPISDSDAYTSDDNASLGSIPKPVGQAQTRRRPLVSPFSLADRYKMRNRTARRRTNQFNLLKGLVGIEELNEDEEVFPENYGISAFTSLFTQNEKMKVWNNFIELSEEQQTSIIESDLSACDYSSDEIETDDDMSVDSNHSDSFVKVDMRSVHPSYSSEECFKRIAPRYGSVLLAKHLPMGMLEHLEGDIRRCFNDCLFSVYESDMNTGFGRLLVHIIAAYLNLQSITVDDGTGRRVRVINDRSEFSPSDQLLCEVIEEKRKSGLR